MATESVKYLLVGGGAAAAQASVGIREVDADGSAMIVCLEPRMPYDRPPLSKGFLNYKPADPEDVESKDSSFYREKNITVRPGTEVVSIDRASKTATLSTGDVVSYEKLLLATGATPRPLQIKGADLPNVFLFRTVDDAEAVRTLAKTAENIALIGAGYIGMEVGASLRQQGKNVTIIDPNSQPWSKFASPITGNFLRAYFENQGVRFLFGDEAQEIAGEGTAQVVRTKNGHAAPADLVVIGIGVTLNTDLARNAGLELHEKGGVKANEFFQSETDPDIYVAGDIAAFKDKQAGKQWHAEHYMNAKWTGKQAGRNMAGANEPYDKVAYFFSDMFDLMMVLRGDPQGGRARKVLGDVDTAEFVELYANDNDEVVMGLAVTRDGDKYDPIVDALELVIQQRRSVGDVQAGDVGL
jgi:3-phenylpropionate/trans-cinnamate dioxygenase ferredoxin reductase subunit